MFSVKAIQPQKLTLVSCTKCSVKSDFNDRFCQKCGEILPKPTGEKVLVKKPSVEPVNEGPEFIGSVEVSAQGGSGFVVDPRTGEKRYEAKVPHIDVRK